MRAALLLPGGRAWHDGRPGRGLALGLLAASQAALWLVRGGDLLRGLLHGPLPWRLAATTSLGLLAASWLLDRAGGVRPGPPAPGATARTICLAYVAVALLAPALSPQDPNRIGDGVATRNLPPLSRVHLVQRADGSVFTATAIELDGEMLRVLRGGTWTEVPRSSLQGRRPDDWHRWRWHWLGTDHLGRDLLSRMLSAAPVSLGVGLAAALLAAGLGGLWGGLAGLSGQRLDGALMRIADAFMAFPRLYLVLLVLAVLPGSLAGAVLVLAATGWMAPARLVRARVLATREQDFVVAARAAGRGRAGILLRHLLPHAAAPLLVAAGLRIGETMLLEAGLSFLGLGVPPPQASWGNLIAAGRSDLMGAWWVSVLPGVLLAGAVLSFNALAEQARRALAQRARATQG